MTQGLQCLHCCQFHLNNMGGSPCICPCHSSDGFRSKLRELLQKEREEGVNSGILLGKVNGWEAGKSEAFSLVRKMTEEMAMEKYEYHSPTLNEFFTRLSTLEGK